MMGLVLEDHPRTCQWIISMGSKSPKDRVVGPLLNGLNGLYMGATNYCIYLLSGMILQVRESSPKTIQVYKPERRLFTWWFSFWSPPIFPLTQAYRKYCNLQKKLVFQSYCPLKIGGSPFNFMHNFHVWEAKTEAKAIYSMVPKHWCAGLVPKARTNGIFTYMGRLQIDGINVSPTCSGT